MIGMLWFEADAKKSLSDRIAEAVKYYRDKYGQEPDICVLPGGSDAPGLPGIKIICSRSIQKNHLLIGIENGAHPTIITSGLQMTRSA